MLKGEALSGALSTVPTVPLNGVLVRMIPRDWLEKKRPPDFLFASGKPNRFNPAGVECVYFSEDEETARSEYFRLWRGAAGGHQPRTIYFAKVQLAHVLDLTEERTLAFLDLTEEDLYRPWRLAQSLTATQLLGDAVSRQTRVSGIRYPSDATRETGGGGVNVVVFRDSVRHPDRVEILGPSKQPLQSWP
jgi:RES domain-containing protein